MQKVNSAFILPFIDATHSMFEIMLQKKISRKEVYVKTNYVMFGDISGSIGVSGNVCGTVSVSLPGPFALDCIRTMIGEDEHYVMSDMDLHDGVGELINMIAGGAKTTLSNTQNAFNFTLPTIVSGRGHEMHHRQGTCNTSVIFADESGQEFALDLCTQN